MKIYHVETQEAYDTLMSELEEKGYKWLSGYEPTSKNYWKSYNKNICIVISDKYITFGPFKQIKKQHQNTPIIEYKAKGENMLNTECKHCHKKWHHTNAKYCTMCGKKLVEEPEFKSGDIVSSLVFSDGSFGLVLLNKDLTNLLTPVDGLWYIKRDCDITDMSLVVFKEYTRHATPEEIAEYESALQFHKHGRQPFEVKGGDILRDNEVNVLFVASSRDWEKEDFTSGRYTFLKTAEECNEWLGTDDEN